MYFVHRLRLRGIAVVALGAMILGDTAFAQTVNVFEDAPSIEQLRSIMIPESQPGISRAIVIPQPDAAAAPGSMHRVAVEALPAPRTPVAQTASATSSVAEAATSAPAPAQSSVSTPDAVGEAGAVAFRVNFAFNSAALPNTARPMIDMIAQLMKEAPQVKVRVEGHTDAAGAANYNVSLSERRALSVGEYLVKQGVEPSRLILIGKGMGEPLSSNRYDPTNRRVQFVRIG